MSGTVAAFDERDLKMNTIKNAASTMVLGMSLALSSLAQAQMQSRPAAVEGPYIGLGAGLTGFKLKKDDFNVAGSTGRSFDQRDKGFKIFGGYRFNDHWGVEAQVASLGESKVSYRGALGSETYKTSAASVAAVGLLPLGSDFTLFAKLGPSITSAESSFSTAALGKSSKSRRAGALAGVGASYRLTDNLSLRGELETYVRVGETAKAGRSTVGMASAGLALRF